MAEQDQEEREPKDFFEKLKVALKKAGAEDLADSLRKFSNIRVPDNPPAMKEALDFFLRMVFVEITAETKSGVEKFVCCSDYGFVKKFSQGKNLRPPKELGSNSRDPFRTKSRTLVLTWDLLNNKFVSFKTDKRWEITGIPIKVPEDISPKFAELLHEVLYKLYKTERKRHD